MPFMNAQRFGAVRREAKRHAALTSTGQEAYFKHSALTLTPSRPTGGNSHTRLSRLPKLFAFALPG
jgi:hypothetical protein